ncbi:MAG: ATP-binding protein [Kofleriaceae bacterium]
MEASQSIADAHAVASAEVGQDAALDLRALQTNPLHMAEAEREFARRFRSGTFMSFAMLTVAQALFQAGGPLWLRGPAVGLAAVLVILRLWVISLVRRDLRSRRFRTTITTLGAVLFPAVWGVLYAGHLHTYGATSGSAALGVMVCGVAAGIITSMVPAPKVQQAALVALLLPLPLASLYTGDLFGWALMNVLFWSYASAQSRANSRDYWRALGTSDLLARHAASLRRANAERKQMEENLRFAERMASLGTLAAGVAHEINNPMTYVLGNLEYACDLLDQQRETGAPCAGGDAASLHELLREAQDGARRVARIVRDLKAFSRYSDEDPLVPVALEDALDTAADMAMAHIRHRASLERDYRGLTLVMGSQVRLGQVFINLVVNAAQAIPDTGSPAKDRIVLRTYLDEAGRCVAEVEDTGVGIAPEVRPRIFDPFFTTKPVGIGTGLGMSSALGIVSVLGGEIDVDSTPNVGTVVRVRFPRAELTIAEPRRPQPATALPAP